MEVQQNCPCGHWQFIIEPTQPVVLELVSRFQIRIQTATANALRCSFRSCAPIAAAPLDHVVIPNHVAPDVQIATEPEEESESKGQERRKRARVVSDHPRPPPTQSKKSKSGQQKLKTSLIHCFEEHIERELAVFDELTDDALFLAIKNTSTDYCQSVYDYKQLRKYIDTFLQTKHAPVLSKTHWPRTIGLLESIRSRIKSGDGKGNDDTLESRGGGAAIVPTLSLRLASTNTQALVYSFVICLKRYVQMKNSEISRCILGNATIDTKQNTWSVQGPSSARVYKLACTNCGSPVITHTDTCAFAIAHLYDQLRRAMPPIKGEPLLLAPRIGSVTGLRVRKIALQDIREAEQHLKKIIESQTEPVPQPPALPPQLPTPVPVPVTVPAAQSQLNSPAAAAQDNQSVRDQIIVDDDDDEYLSPN